MFSEVPFPNYLDGLPVGKKIILYAPTFSRKLTSVPKVINDLEKLPNDDEFILIKLHDLHDKSERELLSQLPTNKFKLIDDPDITPLIKRADAIISDTSSVVYEFALLKPTVVLIEPKQKKLPFIKCKAVDLRKAIDQVWRISPKRKTEIKTFINGIQLYQDSKNAERIMDVVLSPDFIETINKLPKRRNLIRRIKLRYYDLFKKGYVK